MITFNPFTPEPSVVPDNYLKFPKTRQWEKSLITRWKQLLTFKTDTHIFVKSIFKKMKYPNDKKALYATLSNFMELPQYLLEIQEGKNRRTGKYVLND